MTYRRQRSWLTELQLKLLLRHDEYVNEVLCWESEGWPHMGTFKALERRGLVWRLDVPRYSSQLTEAGRAAVAAYHMGRFWLRVDGRR